MIRVQSSSLAITQRPQIATAVAGNSNGVAGASFGMAQGIQLVGTAVIAGDAGDATAGWQLGFVQAQWIETNWACYRGAREADGSVFLQRARPPARPKQSCFDCLQAGGPFYGSGANPPTQASNADGSVLRFVQDLPNPAAFPVTVKAIHADFPGDFFPFQRTNNTTHAVNFLSECQLEFFFCVSLILRERNGQKHFLQNLYWNVNWQNSFRFDHAHPNAPPTITNTRGDYPNKANVGRVIPGIPTDARFASILRTGSGQTCNQIASNAANNPNVKETRAWTLFDVRQ